MNDDKRISAKAPFTFEAVSKLKGMGLKLFLILIFILMSLPLFSSFNDILTKIVLKAGVYKYLSQNVVPMETRAVSWILKPLGIQSRPSTNFLYISNKSGEESAVFFSWNCLGWQSVVLLILTLFIGLSGKHKLVSKIETVVFGICGVFLINLVRISTIVYVSHYFGQLPARIIHEYLGTVFTILWFFFFWWFSYRFILEEK